MCETTFHRLKCFFPSGPGKSVAAATNQPEKTFQLLKSFFWVFLSHWHFFEALQRKLFSLRKVFPHTFRHIAVPHSIWLRVRVAQCAMALRVMVQSHVGWPWECHRSPDTSLGTILDEYALHDGWHPSCYRLLRHTRANAVGPKKCVKKLFTG